MITYKFTLELCPKRGPRLIKWGPDGTLGGAEITVGSRTHIVKAFADYAKGIMPDAKPPKYQTHTLPNFVKTYFGTRDVEMRRDENLGGFTFSGPMFICNVQKYHACSARKEVAEMVRRKLKEQAER